jgi:hypothetical protein
MDIKVNTNWQAWIPIGITAIFVILKLTNIIKWSWFWVLFPLWLWLVVVILLFTAVIVVAILAEAMKRW